MLSDNRKLGLMGLVVATAVFVHAGCPEPKPNGVCGYPSMIADCSNECCEITGPGQVPRKSCLGTSGTTDCDNNPSNYSWTFTKYKCVDGKCDHDPANLPDNNCGGGVPNPYTYHLSCDNAVSRTTTNCMNPSE